MRDKHPTVPNNFTKFKIQSTGRVTNVNELQHKCSDCAKAFNSATITGQQRALARAVGKLTTVVGSLDFTESYDDLVDTLGELELALTQRRPTAHDAANLSLTAVKICNLAHSLRREVRSLAAIHQAALSDWQEKEDEARADRYSGTYKINL